MDPTLNHAIYDRCTAYRFPVKGRRLNFGFQQPRILIEVGKNRREYILQNGNFVVFSKISCWPPDRQESSESVLNIEAGYLGNIRNPMFQYSFSLSMVRGRPPQSQPHPDHSQ